MSKVFGITVEYENKLELIQKVLDIHFALFPPEKRLHQLEKEALSYYIAYGYDRETSKEIESSLSRKIKGNYARNINSTLQSKGYLVKDTVNLKKRHLSKEMEKYREYFKKGDVRFFPIMFKKK